MSPLPASIKIAEVPESLGASSQFISADGTMSSVFFAAKDGVTPERTNAAVKINAIIFVVILFLFKEEVCKFKSTVEIHSFLT